MACWGNLSASSFIYQATGRCTIRFPLYLRLKPAFLLVLFFVVSAATALAQPIIGCIIGAETHKTLPYANIGVVGQPLGTVADEQGNYRLPFGEKWANETVRISSLGYAPRTLTLSELAAHPNIALVPEAVALAEVQVRGRAFFRRTHTLGNTGNSEMATNTLTNGSLGGQVGTVIELSRRPTRIRNAVFNIARSSPGQVTFRVNFYRLDSKGGPTDVKLLTRDVIVTSPVVRGPITVDLSADQLTLDENFFLAIELLQWVGAAPSGAEFAFSATVGYTHNQISSRSVSQTPWKRASVGMLLAGMQPKLCFYVTVND